MFFLGLSRVFLFVCEDTIREEELQERIDDRLHLMLMELINVHGALEKIGLVTRVEPLNSSIGFEGPDSFEPVITNKARPPISVSFLHDGQAIK